MTEVETPAAPLLSIRNLSKSFGAVKAVNNINLDILPSEVIGLIGDNAAGKSTFLSLLSGYNIKDTGEFHYRGKRVSFNSPRTSRRNLKIEMIYQNLSLAPDLTVWQNVYLGEELKKFGIFNDRKEMIRRTGEVLKHLSSTAKPTNLVETLSGGEQQIVAISRALLFDRELILMDEPTAAISVSKIKEVLRLIQDLKAHGKSIILVSHRLEDVLTVADRIVVFSHGNILEILDNKDLSLGDLIRVMFGDSVGKGAQNE
ncbi:MAG: ATP-binding cassette domain-containing protein [Bacilli bacterium]